MAFQIKEWLDRIVEHPTRRTITDTTTGVSQEVDVSRTEGQVTQEGTPLGAITFNDLESRIATAFDEKQDTLIAGENITIENNVISATGGGGTASNELVLKLHIDENTEGLNSAINLNDLSNKLTFFKFVPDDGESHAIYRPISPFSFSGNIYWTCDDPRIIKVTFSSTMISVWVRDRITKAEYEQIIADSPVTLYLWENDIEETQRYYATRLDSKFGNYNHFCYITEKTNKIENGYVDFVVGTAYDSTLEKPLRVINTNFSIDSLVNKGYIINEVKYATGTVELNYDGVNSFLNRKFEAQNTEIKEEIIQLNDTKADKSALAETDFSLDMLWKLSKGQTYDIQTKVESGMNVPPNGAKYETLLDVRGKSEQFSTNGYNLLPYPYSDTTVTRNGITFTDNGDGTITLNGTSTSEVVFSFNPNSNKVFLNLKNVKLKWFFSYYADYGINLQADIYDSNDVYIYTTQQSVSSYYDDAYYFKNCRIRIASAGVSVNNLRIYPMLCVDSATNYEPYTGGIPSPNPDYPQEIKSVEEINIKKTGKNLWNELWETGSLDRVGEDYPSTTQIRSIGYTEVKSSSVYYVTVTYGSGNNDGLEVFYYDLNRNYISSVYVRGDSTNKIFTTPANCKYIRFRTFSSYGSTYRNDLCFSVTKTDYEPYHEETHQIIPPFALNKIGEYYDFADIDNGMWVVNTGEYTFTGSEEWTSDTNGAKFISYSDRLTGFFFGKDVTNQIYLISERISTDILSNVRNSNLPMMGVQYPTSHNYSRFWISPVTDINSLIGIKVFIVRTEPTETPINAEDLAYLKSLSIMETDNNILTITDQNGNDISYLMEYIIKLNEVN